MTNPRYYKLPTGDVTKDVDYFIDSWRQLGERVEKLLDVRMVGFDPGFAFMRGDHAIRMPVDVAQMIVGKYDALQQQLDQVKDVLLTVQEQLNCYEDDLPANFDERVIQWVNDTVAGNPPKLRV